MAAVSGFCGMNAAADGFVAAGLNPGAFLDNASGFRIDPKGMAHHPIADVRKNDPFENVVAPFGFPTRDIRVVCRIIAGARDVRATNTAVAAHKKCKRHFRFPSAPKGQSAKIGKS